MRKSCTTSSRSREGGRSREWKPVVPLYSLLLELSSHLEFVDNHSIVSYGDRPIILERAQYHYFMERNRQITEASDRKTTMYMAVYIICKIRWNPLKKGSAGRLFVLESQMLADAIPFLCADHEPARFDHAVVLCLRTKSTAGDLLSKYRCLDLMQVPPALWQSE